MQDFQNAADNVILKCCYGHLHHVFSRRGRLLQLQFIYRSKQKNMNICHMRVCSTLTVMYSYYVVTDYQEDSQNAEKTDRQQRELSGRQTVDRVQADSRQTYRQTTDCRQIPNMQTGTRQTEDWQLRECRQTAYGRQLIADRHTTGRNLSDSKQIYNTQQKDIHDTYRQRTDIQQMAGKNTSDIERTYIRQTDTKQTHSIQIPKKVYTGSRQKTRKRQTDIQHIAGRQHADR